MVLQLRTNKKEKAVRKKLINLLIDKTNYLIVKFLDIDVI